MKIVLSILLCIALLSAVLAVPAAAVTEEETGGYYIVNSRYDYCISDYFRMFPLGGHYWLHAITLSTADRIKIARSSDGRTIDRLYPEGEDDWYVPQYNSQFYTVEFAPLGDGGMNGDTEWFMGTIKAWPCEPPEDDDPQPVPVEQEDFSFNRFEDRFEAAFPYAAEEVDYQEIYAHDARWEPDWVLVRTRAVDPIEGDYYGVFDDVVLYTAESVPFDCGYGVYDVAADRFYSITQAWNMGFADLHDVFVNTALSDSGTSLLGDADMDKELTIIDVTLIQRFLAGITDLDDCGSWLTYYGCAFGTPLPSLADYDDDGEVTIVDATRIQRTLVGSPLYPHRFTVCALPEKKDDGWYINAFTAFGEEPVTYRYAIRGGFHAYSVYGDDWGDFTYQDPDYEPVPGEFYITTGELTKNSVRLPLDSLTYNDSYSLVITAKDAYGHTDTIYLPFTDRYTINEQPKAF